MDFNKIKELENNCYMPLFNRANLCFTHGEGNKLYDINGKEYTDFVAGIAVNSLGYNHPELVDAICNQAHKLIHVSNLYYNQPQSELAYNLLEGTIFSRVFLCNSGAEANEGAIKLIRKHYYKLGINKPKILCAINSFHGRTLATLTATGQPKYSRPYSPLPEGFIHTPYNDFESLKNALTDDVGAVMLEPVQGESGVTPADYDFLVNTYALCKQKGILLVLDEVQTGMGRTGKTFCFEHYGIQPDIVTLAKGLAGGVPIGAVLARGQVAEAFSAGDHGTTFGGNPLACAAAGVVVKKVKDEQFMSGVNDAAQHLKDRLMMLRKYKFVVDVRGIGLMQGLQLDEKLKNAEIIGKMASAGFLIASAGQNTLRFIPPLTITVKEIDEMAEKLTEIFANTNI